MKRKVLVCGATGFIGRNIAETLAQKEEFEVYGTYLKSAPLDNSGIKMIRADLTNKEDVELAVKGMDLIIQAAATTSGVKDILTKPYIHVTDNAVMNSLIFRSAYEHKVGQVVFSAVVLCISLAMFRSRKRILTPTRKFLKAILALAGPRFTLKKCASFIPE